MSITAYKTFAAGEVLTAADLNSSFSNIINNAADLISPLTKAISMGGFALYLDGASSIGLQSTTNGINVVGGAFNEVHGADIASAATLNLDTATGNLVDVTGTTTITAITLANGRERVTRFTGALTLTHGASLVLPGGANITTAAGDFAVWRGYAAGVVRLVASSASSMHSWIQSGTGSVARAEQTKMREIVSAEDFGASPSNSAAVNRAAIQAAIDAVYATGRSGEVWLDGIYPINANLLVPQRVWLVGKGGAFVNQFVTGSAAPKGSGLFMATGSNDDCIVFRCDLYNDAGTLKETTHNTVNGEARHGGGARNLIVWGNRSLTETPSAVDLNSTGDGIRIEGSRYVTLNNVIAMFCAGDGVEMASHDYGTGAISSNNLTMISPKSLSNAGHGYRLAGGDVTITDPVAGYNAVSGCLWTCSGTVTGGLLWNNGKHGFQATTTTDTSSAAVTGVHAYDNDETGFRVDGTTRSPTFGNCVARGNGRDTGASATDRCNFLIGASVTGWSLAGCRSYARDQDAVLVTQHGFRILNTTYSGVLDGTSDEGSVNPYTISDYSKIISHGGVSGAVSHPPVQFAELTTTPTVGAASAAINVYMKADKLVFQYDDAGTTRYKYLDMTGTGVTWVHATVAP